MVGRHNEKSYLRVHATSQDPNIAGRALWINLKTQTVLDFRCFSGRRNDVQCVLKRCSGEFAEINFLCSPVTRFQVTELHPFNLKVVSLHSTTIHLISFVSFSFTRKVPIWHIRAESANEYLTVTSIEKATNDTRTDRESTCVSAGKGSHVQET